MVSESALVDTTGNLYNYNIVESFVTDIYFGCKDSFSISNTTRGGGAVGIIRGTWINQGTI